MKRSIAVLITCAFATGIAMPAQATGDKHGERFSNTEPLEPMARSRTDAAEAAAQVPGAAGVLLEALRWRGRTARQIGLPTKLWCADFMNFVLRPRRRQRHAIARGALVPAIRQEARRPARRRHRHPLPQGSQQRSCRRRARHRRPGQPDPGVGQSWADRHAVGLFQEQGHGLRDAACLRARGHRRCRARRGPQVSRQFSFPSRDDGKAHPLTVRPRCR